MIAIIDYGMGNLRSVQKALEILGFKAEVTNRKEIINSSFGIILPGVGAMPYAVRNLKKMGLDKLIINNIEKGKPFLGICLGLQLLFSKTEEGEGSEGLNLIGGKVLKFPVGLKIPHMGWNQIRSTPNLIRGKNQKLKILDGIPDNSFVYFVHSYYVEPEDEEIVLTKTDYGIEFVSMIAKDKIFGCQFHPEKSQKVGLQILKNFGEICYAHNSGY